MALARWTVLFGCVATIAIYAMGAVAMEAASEGLRSGGWGALAALTLFRGDTVAALVAGQNLWTDSLSAMSLVIGPGGAAAARIAGGEGDPWAAGTLLLLLAAAAALHARGLGAPRLLPGPAAPLDALSILCAAAVVSAYAVASLLHLLSYATGDVDLFQKMELSLITLRGYADLLADAETQAWIRWSEIRAAALSRAPTAAQAAPGLLIWTLALIGALQRAKRALRLRAAFPFLGVAPELQPWAEKRAP